MSRQMRKIMIAPNAFKGSLTAWEAACCIERGLKTVWPNAHYLKIPLADGGDGTVLAVVAATHGKLMHATVHDPLGRPIKAAWGLTGNGATAVIEMATASGLALLTPRERNPMVTSTVGTGELIRAALRRGVRKILIGIGGSATNDGGMGMARALGVRFLDRRGHDLPEGGGALPQLARIDMQGLDRRLRAGNVELELACDVTNPLTGPHGASCVYGPQKGATPRMVAQLDAGLGHLAAIIQRDLGKTVEHVPGAGAAGGLGAGLLAFLGARPRSGVDILLEVTDLPRQLRGCDLVITGEGRLDVQTISGKAPGGVAKAAKSLEIPVLAICGSVAPDAPAVLKLGIDAYFSALEQIIDESELRALGPGMLERCAAQVGRLLTLNLKRLEVPQKNIMRNSASSKTGKKP